MEYSKELEKYPGAKRWYIDPKKKGSYILFVPCGDKKFQFVSPDEESQKWLRTRKHQKVNRGAFSFVAEALNEYLKNPTPIEERVSNTVRTNLRENPIGWVLEQCAKQKITPPEFENLGTENYGGSSVTEVEMYTPDENFIVTAPSYKEGKKRLSLMFAEKHFPEEYKKAMAEEILKPENKTQVTPPADKVRAEKTSETPDELTPERELQLMERNWKKWPDIALADYCKAKKFPFSYNSVYEDGEFWETLTVKIADDDERVYYTESRCPVGGQSFDTRNKKISEYQKELANMFRRNYMEPRRKKLEKSLGKANPPLVKDTQSEHKETRTPTVAELVALKNKYQR